MIIIGFTGGMSCKSSFNNYLIINK